MSPELTTILSLSCEHSRDGFATPVSRPRLSWRFAGDAPDWVQKSYEIKIISSDGRIQEFSVTSPESILQPWPGSPLKSGEKATVAVRAYGSDDVWTEWAELPIEATLLQPDDWSACMVSCHAQPMETSKRPFRVRKEFELDLVEGARLYITALGIYEVEVNGHRLDDTVFSPGWTSYGHRLRFETMDLSKYLHVGANCIGVYIGEGWYAGRLGYDGGVRNIYGTRLGVRAELWNQGEKVLVTDTSWEWSYGPLITSEFYDGEVYDARLDDSVWTQDPGNSNADWSPVEVIPNTSARLIPFDAPLVRKMEMVEAKKILATPSGKVIIDFGQNLVGRIRFNVNPSTKPGNSIVLSHAEVLEHGELATRPLRVAKCQDTVIVGGTVLKGWEPRFTFHGFRYMQVDGWEGCQPSDFTAVVIHSDMERTGWFQCSHGLVNKLHENVVWSMKGNFLSVPTDCPQRDER
jgi:alpha-L-rhamnosidase